VYWYIKIFKYSNLKVYKYERQIFLKSFALMSTSNTLLCSSRSPLQIFMLLIKILKLKQKIAKILLAAGCWTRILSLCSSHIHHQATRTNQCYCALYNIYSFSNYFGVGHGPSWPPLAHNFSRIMYSFYYVRVHTKDRQFQQEAILSCHFLK
jgi:hypothetical protein